MDTENVTLALPEDVLRKVRLLAIRRNTSVAELLTEALEHLAEAEAAYEEAKQRQLEWLERGFDMGTGDGPLVSRDELHER